MRKELIATPTAGENTWFDLETQASVRLTSEDPAWPIEGALRSGSTHGWKAAQPGAQTIWIHFDAQQPVNEVHVRFEATDERTQEFVILSSTDDGRSYQPVVRQQFNFSRSSPVESEHYFPHLTGVTDLKLTVTPNISGGETRATLAVLRIR